MDLRKRAGLAIAALSFAAAVHAQVPQYGSGLK